MSDCVFMPNDLVSEAERVLAVTPPPEYAATRSAYIDEAITRFGGDVAREVADALPVGPLPLAVHPQ
jgi:hypothetical protein